MSIAAIRELLGNAGFVEPGSDMAPYLREWRDRWHGKAALVARPCSTEEVAGVVRICAGSQIEIVPQGGHTGLCGGAMPDESGTQIVLALDRMNRIRDIDADGYVMAVDAGCTLAAVQEAAAEADRLFPLRIASEGSAQIGGALSTNAGGNTVLRYGNARNLALGLEVVLPDGRVWDGLRALRKDNTGYDLKQLFIGAEGTLGIITGAALKLYPAERQAATAFVALASPKNAVDLLPFIRGRSGDQLSSFELIPRLGLDFVLRHMEGCTDPLGQPHPWYALIELTSSEAGNGLEPLLQAVLEDALADRVILDAAIAQSASQRAGLWQLRENLSEAQKFEGGSIKHDVAVPIARIPEFLKKAIAAVQAEIPGIRPIPFGHIGDGNIHFNLSQPPEADKQDFLARWEEINRIVHDIVVALGGSISAEHGVGQLKVDEIVHYKDPVEIDLMRRLKMALDPGHIMNPGKVIRPR